MYVGDDGSKGELRDASECVLGVLATEGGTMICTDGFFDRDIHEPIL